MQHAKRLALAFRFFRQIFSNFGKAHQAYISALIRPSINKAIERPDRVCSRSSVPLSMAKNILPHIFGGDVDGSSTSLA